MTELPEVNNSAEVNDISWFRKFASIACGLALALVIVGMIVRVTFRDQYLLPGLIYYVASPASMVLLLLFSAVCLRRDSGIKRRLAIGLIPIAACWVWNVQWIDSKAPEQSVPKPSHRVMFWNVCEGKLGWSRVFDTIRTQDPDIIALAEAEELKVHDDDFFEQHFPGYQRICLPRRLLLLSRLPIVSRDRLRWVRGAVHESVVIESQQGPVTVVFSDVASEIWKHRKVPIESLVEATGKLSGPVIVVGDLNTPVDSLFFDEFRHKYTNAFEGSGSGLHTTWPMPLPVIAIDHMWGNDLIDFANARILWTLASDHRPLIAEFSAKDNSQVKSPSDASSE